LALARTDFLGAKLMNWLRRIIRPNASKAARDLSALSKAKRERDNLTIRERRIAMTRQIRADLGLGDHGGLQ